MTLGKSDYGDLPVDAFDSIDTRRLEKRDSVKMPNSESGGTLVTLQG
jgi:hypothetical protein